MHHSTNGTLVEATTTRAKEERQPAVGGRQRWSADQVPPFNGLDSRDTEGNGPLLVALAKHSDHVASLINVVDIEANQLTDPDTGGIEKFQHRVVAQLFGANLARRFLDRGFEQGNCLGLRQNTRQKPLGLGGRKDQSGIGREPAASSAECAKHSGGRRVPSDRCSRLAGGGQLGQPAA